MSSNFIFCWFKSHGFWNLKIFLKIFFHRIEVIVSRWSWSNGNIFALLAIAMELVFIEFFRVVVLKGRQFISTFI